jgi:hypothetical protein
VWNVAPSLFGRVLRPWLRMHLLARGYATMKTLFLALVISGAAIGGTLPTKAATVVITEYNWDHPYWHHHHYGYWHHHRGYWAYRHGEHIFVTID